MITKMSNQLPPQSMNIDMHVLCPGPVQAGASEISAMVWVLEFAIILGSATFVPSSAIFHPQQRRFPSPAVPLQS